MPANLFQLLLARAFESHVFSSQFEPVLKDRIYITVIFFSLQHFVVAARTDAFLSSVHLEMAVDPLSAWFWQGDTLQDPQEKSGFRCGDERLYVPIGDTCPSAGDTCPSVGDTCASALL